MSTSAETVPVPRALVDDLWRRAYIKAMPTDHADEVIVKWSHVQDFIDAAAVIARLAERRPAGGGETAARCRCGHGKQMHAKRCASLLGCDCEAFTPAPPPTPPREELADLQTRLDNQIAAGDHDLNEVRKVWTRCKTGWTLPRDVVSGMDVVLGTTVPVADWFNSDPPAGAATPPTTAELPTAPGSVIEAAGASGVPRLWFHRDEPRYWINDNGTIAGDSALTLVRVRFDAGERGEP